MKELKQAHPMDKFVGQLMPNVAKPKLTIKEQEDMERYWKIFMWRCKMHSPEHTRQLIMREYALKYSRACELYNNMEYIFGKTEELNKNVHRRVLVEHLYTAIQLAAKNNNEDSIIKATDKIAQLLGLYEGDPAMDPTLMMPKRTVNYIVQKVERQILMPNS